MNSQAPALSLSHQENQMVRLVVETFNRLAAQKDLSPHNQVVNESLTHYVNAVVHADSRIEDKDRILNNDAVRDVTKPLRALLSRAEFAMEDYFAKLLLREGPMPESGLSKFWYRANYKALIDIEVDGLKNFFGEKDVFADPRPIAFVGSGPLPLSAIDIYLTTGKHCTCIEMDPVAAKESRQLIHNIGLSNAITVVQSNGKDMNYAGYSVVFLAALAEGKGDMLKQIAKTASDTIIGIRSADGLKKLLYAPVDIKKVEQASFSYRGTTIATDEVVNSTCFFQFAHRL